MAKSNAEQVAKIVRIAHELGIEPASPAETRQLLGLKGIDRVNFQGPTVAAHRQLELRSSCRGDDPIEILKLLKNKTVSSYHREGFVRML